MMEGLRLGAGMCVGAIAERRTRRVMVRMPALPPRVSLSPCSWRSPSVPTRGVRSWGWCVYHPETDERAVSTMATDDWLH